MFPSLTASWLGLDGLCACGGFVGDTNTFAPWKLNVRPNRLFKDFIDVRVWDSRNECVFVCVLS